MLFGYSECLAEAQQDQCFWEPSRYCLVLTPVASKTAFAPTSLGLL